MSVFKIQAYQLSLLLHLVAVTRAQKPAPLRLLTLLPYASDDPAQQPLWDGGPDLIPAAYLAVDLINNSSQVLPDYRLELLTEDGGCDLKYKAVINFVRYAEYLKKSRPVVGLIGGLCSISSQAVASLLTVGEGALSLMNIHLADYPRFREDRISYGNSLAILGSSRGFAEAVVALMRRTGWRRIGILLQNGIPIFTSVVRELQTNAALFLPDSKIECFSANSLDILLARIRSSLLRVVVVMAASSYTRYIMRVAYGLKMFYPSYQWIFVFRLPNEFIEDIENGLITPNVLDQSIYLDFKVNSIDEDKTSVSGLSYLEFQDMYAEYIENYNSRNPRPYNLPGVERNASWTSHAGILFDAVWAFALALDRVERSGVNLSQYGIGQPHTTQLLREALYSRTFLGVSGPVDFDPATGYNARAVVYTQVHNGTETLVGYANSAVFAAEGEELVSIPDEFDRQADIVHPLIAATFTVVTLILAILIVITHIINICNRTFPSIKANSPLLTQITYFGGYIAIITTVVQIMHNAIPLNQRVSGIICHALWGWLFSLSYTLVLGAICARTWRIYRIFVHVWNPGPLISDSALLVAISVLVIIEVIISALWTVVDPLRMEIRAVEVSEKEETLLLERESICTCQYKFLWLALMYLRRFSIIILAITLSALTKGIKKRNFSTKSVRVLVYFLGFQGIFSVVFYHTFIKYNLSVHYYYTALCINLNIFLLLILCLVFVPPLLPLFQDWLSKESKFHKSFNCFKFD